MNDKQKKFVRLLATAHLLIGIIALLGAAAILYGLSTDAKPHASDFDVRIPAVSICGILGVSAIASSTGIFKKKLWALNFILITGILLLLAAAQVLLVSIVYSTPAIAAVLPAALGFWTTLTYFRLKKRRDRRAGKY